jgi:hypothetical protein
VFKEGQTPVSDFFSANIQLPTIDSGTRLHEMAKIDSGCGSG